MASFRQRDFRDSTQQSDAKTRFWYVNRSRAARKLLASFPRSPYTPLMAGQGMQQSQNLSLQQVLAPQLQQSLLILQAPLLELRNLVQQEMETNPVLEELPDPPKSEDGSEPETPADENFKEEFDKLAKLDEE